MTPDDPREQIRQLVADARRDFALDVDGLLQELQAFSEGLGDAIGEVSRDEALRGLRSFVLEKFDQRLTLQHPETETLRQLVREASDLLNNPESTVDLRDWTRAAAPFVVKS